MSMFPRHRISRLHSPKRAPQLLINCSTTFVEVCASYQLRLQVLPLLRMVCCCNTLAQHTSLLIKC